MDKFTTSAVKNYDKAFKLQNISFYNEKNKICLLINILYFSSYTVKYYFVNEVLKRVSRIYKYKTQLDYNYYYYKIDENTSLQKKVFKKMDEPAYYLLEKPKNRKKHKQTKISKQEFYMHKIKTL